MLAGLGQLEPTGGDGGNKMKGAENSSDALGTSQVTILVCNLAAGLKAAKQQRIFCSTPPPPTPELKGLYHASESLATLEPSDRKAV